MSLFNRILLKVKSRLNVLNEISTTIIIPESSKIKGSLLKGEVIISENCAIVASEFKGKISIRNFSSVKDSTFKGEIEIGEYNKILGVTLLGKIKTGNFTSLWGPNIDIHSNQIASVSIGNFCSIARNVSFQSFNHNFKKPTSYFIGQNFFKVGLYDKKEKVMKFGVVNINQKAILPVQFQDVELGYNFHNFNDPNVFLVKKNNLYGLTSETNEEILPVNFDFISKVNSNETFLLLEKNKKYTAFVKYYNGNEKITEIIPSYFEYKIRQVVFKNSPKKFYPKNVVQAIDYLVLEDENGDIKGYANPDGTLYFKD